MKKIILVVISAAIALTVISCGSKTPTINAGKIKKLCTQQMKELGANQAYASIDTGYYELNSKPMRDELKKLEAAGLITYSVERYAWYNKVTDKKTVKHSREMYSYWYGWYTDSYYTSSVTTGYELEEHFMVKVGLTSKGKKITVDSIPAGKENVDKDMQYPEYKASDWPEDSIDLSENWPEIPYPEKNKTDEKSVVREASPEKDYSDIDYTSSQTNKETSKYPIIECLDKNTKAQYEAAKQRESKEESIVKAYCIKVAKVRNILLGEVGGIPVAQAEVMLKTSKVTHAGHILMDGVINGIPASQSVSLKHYVDKGWVLDDDSMEELLVGDVSIEELVDEE